MNPKINKLEALFQSMCEGVVIQDKDGKICEVNSAALSILGLTSNEILGITSLDPRWRAIKENGEDYPGEEHPASLALRTGVALRNKIMGIYHSTGALRWISINAIPLFEDNSKEQTGVIVTFNDITEARTLAKNNESARMRLEIGMRAVKFGIFDWDFKNNILVWDDYMYEVFGIEKGDFNGAYEAFEKTLHKDDVESVQTNIQKTFSSRSDLFHGDFRIIRKSGEVRNILGEAKCFYSSAGEPLRMVGANWDVTEKRKQEMNMLQSSKMSSLGEMSAGIAHEINNPLAIILGKTEFIKKLLSQPNPDTKLLIEHAEKIGQTANRIALIIKGLRSFARDADKDPFEKTPVKTIIEDTLSLCQSRLLSNNVTLKVFPYPEDLFLYCRSIQITQVMVNLLNNAYDAISTQPEKWIHVEIADKDTSIEIAVSDSGSGIPKEIQSKIFQPFFTTKEVGKGTGLGLSVSVGIVQSHHGTFEIDNRSKNTRFVMSFPKKIKV